MYISGANCNHEFIVILNKYELNILIEAMLKKNTEIWEEEVEDQ